MSTLSCNVLLNQPKTLSFFLTSIPASNYFHRLVAGSKKRKLLSLEEQDIRSKEDAIFNAISKQPTCLVGIERAGDDGKETSATKKALIKQEAATKKAARKSEAALAKTGAQKAGKK